MGLNRLWLCCGLQRPLLCCGLHRHWLCCGLQRPLLCCGLQRPLMCCGLQRPLLRCGLHRHWQCCGLQRHWLCCGLQRPWLCCGLQRPWLCCGICVRSSEQGRLRGRVHVRTAACLTAATQLQRPRQPARHTDQLQIQCQTTWGTIKKALAENNKKIKCAFDNRIVYSLCSCCKLSKILTYYCLILT